MTSSGWSADLPCHTVRWQRLTSTGPLRSRAAGKQHSRSPRSSAPFVRLSLAQPLAHSIGHRADCLRYYSRLFCRRLALDAPLARCRRLLAKLLSVRQELARGSTEQLRRVRHNPSLQRSVAVRQPLAWVLTRHDCGCLHIRLDRLRCTVGRPFFFVANRRHSYDENPLAHGNS
jgi:hypothetical protein